MRPTLSRKLWFVVGLALVGGLSGCPPPKSSYTFEGCPNEDGVCSRDITIACAVNAIDDRHSSCVQDADCVEAPPIEGECVPVTQCRHRLVNAAEVKAYVDEVTGELRRYCSEIECLWPAFETCVPPRGNRPACVDGRCRFVE